MAFKASLVLLLICTLTGFAVAGVAQLEVFSGSNDWWIAVAVRGSAVNIQSIAISDAKTSFAPMSNNKDWGYWTYNTQTTTFNLPVSFRVTYTNGAQVTLNNILQVLSGSTQTFSLSDDISSDPVPTTTTTTTKTPSKATITTTTTTKAPSKATTTTTKTPSKTTTTTTTTRAPASTTTTTTTKSANTGTGCAAPTGMMVPLYTYPGASWDTVAAAAMKVPTIAIINPNSGPGNGPDSAYKTYMTKLANANAEMVGYVHTTWGARPWADVKADIDKWAAEFPLVDGIFLDEASVLAKDVPYYTQIYNYIMALPGYKHVILNPGAIPDSGYNAISTQIVSFEDYATNLATAKVPSYASCATKNRYVAMAHTSNSGNMQTVVDRIKNLGYFGWVYITDGAGGCCTYNSISSYYAATAAYMAGK